MDKTITIEVTSDKRPQKVRVVVGKSITLIVGDQEKVYRKGDLARYAYLREVSAIGRIAEVNERKVVLEDYRRTLMDFLKFEELNWDFDNTQVKNLGLFSG